MTRFASFVLALSISGCQSYDADVPAPADEPSASAADFASSARVSATVRSGSDAAVDDAGPPADAELAPPDARPVPEADCTGADYDDWRSWTPRYQGAPRTMVAPAAGLLDGTIVVQGGRASVTTLSNVSGLTFTLATPTCAAPTPDWSTASITSGVAPKVWGAASAVAAHRFFVIGGTTSGAGTCARTTSFFQFTSPDHSTGTWTTLGSLLPQGLCQATASTVVDSAGKEWIVLAGGSTRSLPNTSCAGGFAPTTATLLLDPAAAVPTWTTTTAFDDNVRWGGAVALSADRHTAFVFGGSSATALTGAPTSDGSRFTLATAPAFASGSTLPWPIFSAAAASWSEGNTSRVYLSGGSATLGPASCTGSTSANLLGTDALLAFDPANAGFQPMTPAPARRVFHALLSVPAFAQTKLYALGGSDGTTPVWTIDEYTP
jgi:hypothetical protein